MKRKLLTILLSLAMISIIKTNVFAQDFTGWTPLTSSGGALTGGNYYLTDDITLISNISISDDVTIDLNGHALISNAGSGSVIAIGSGTLTIQDSDQTVEHAGYVDLDGLWHLGTGEGTSKTIKGGIITGGKGDYWSVTQKTYGGGVYVYTNCSFTMNGGTIIGNTATVGGGVYVNGGGTFNMDGGTICGNTGTDGGGVHVGNINGSGTFNMDGGTIYDNTATVGGGVYVNGDLIMKSGSIVGNKTSNDGAGVYVNAGASFTMDGGSITGNTAAANGGGIFINKATFSMNGGTISNNLGQYGAGVCGYGDITGAEFNMVGGTISNNLGQYGAGVHVNNCTFTMGNSEMHNSKISNNIATKDGGGVHVVKSTFTMNGGEISNNSATNTSSENLGGGVYTDQYANYVMNGGTIIGCNADKGGGVFSRGSFTMNNDSEIKECTATIDGGGVCECNNSFIMNDNSKVSECAADNGAGGVYIFGNPSVYASFTMKDNSTISNCKASANYTSNQRSGGGVCIEGNKCVFTMNDGVISNNEATASVGGGVHVYSGTFKMIDGSITRNSAKTNGGGLYNGGAMTLGGAAQITGNVKDGTISNGTLTGGTTNNVYLEDDKNITLGTKTGSVDGNGTAAPTADFNAGVTTQTAPTVANPAKITTNGTRDEVKYFTSDNADYGVSFNTDHLELFVPVAYNSTTYVRYSSLTDAIEHSNSGDVIELWANANSENINLPNGVTLYTKSDYTGTVTTNVTGKAIAKQEMLGSFQYKYSVADLLTITYKDQGNRSFSGTHEAGYPTTFMAEVPTQLKAATKNGYTFGGWFDNAQCNGNPITNFYAYTYTNNLTLYAKWRINSSSSYSIPKTGIE